jgi:hypothetical protein
MYLFHFYLQEDDENRESFDAGEDMPGVASSCARFEIVRIVDSNFYNSISYIITQPFSTIQLLITIFFLIQ